MNVKKCFLSVMLVLIGIFLVLLLIDPLGDQFNVFVLKTNDLFADFYNVLIYISGNDPYFNPLNGPEQKPYFPLAYLFMSLFSGFADYSSMSLSECYSSTTATMSCVIFTLFSILLFFHSLSKLIKYDNKTIIILCLSYVFLYTIERGNLIMIASAMAFYFLAYKDSDEPWKRYFALFSFGVSVTLKGFPVVLGLFLLKDKRYKDIIISVLITLFLIFIPYFAFKHGIENFPRNIYNVQQNSIMAERLIHPRFGLSIFITLLWNYLPTSINEILFYASKSIVWAMALLSVLFFFTEKSNWKKIAMLSFIIGYVPTTNWFYCGIFFIPAILFFLKENEGRKLDYLYALLFCVFLSPIQIVIHDIGGHHGNIKEFPVSWLLANMAIIAVWTMILYESGKQYSFKKMKEIYATKSSL